MKIGLSMILKVYSRWQIVTGMMPTLFMFPTVLLMPTWPMLTIMWVMLHNFEQLQIKSILNIQLNQIKLFSILLQLQSAIFKYPVVNPIKPFCKLLQSQNVNASVSLLEKNILLTTSIVTIKIHLDSSIRTDSFPGQKISQSCCSRIG